MGEKKEEEEIVQNMSNYQLRMSTSTLTLFLATVCLEQYIEFMTLSISNISLYFEHRSPTRESLSISNITLYFEHLSISNISLYFKYLSPFWTSLPISNITLYLEHHSLFRTSLALKHLSTSNIPKITISSFYLEHLEHFLFFYLDLISNLSLSHFFMSNILPY